MVGFRVPRSESTAAESKAGDYCSFTLSKEPIISTVSSVHAILEILKNCCAAVRELESDIF